MSQSKVKTAFVFGAHPSCLLTALQLQSQGFKVTVFDSGESLTKENYKQTEVNFWENNERTKEGIDLLERLLDQPLSVTALDSTPLMLSGDKVSDFVGFGDKKYSSLSAISQLNQRSLLSMNMSPTEIYTRARELFKGEIKTYSKVTQVEFGVDEISGVQINSGKVLTADIYAFTQSPSELVDFLPDEVLSGRLRSKIARTEVFGRLSLQVNFENFPTELEELKNINTFMIPHAADYEPCTGSIDNETATWHSFINSEFAEDPEKLAGQVRHMRKLIQKALPVLESPLRTASISFEKEEYANYETETILSNLLKSNRNMMCTSALWSTSWGISGVLESIMINNEIRTGLMGDTTKRETTNEPTSLEANT